MSGGVVVWTDDGERMVRPGHSRWDQPMRDPDLLLATSVEMRRRDIDEVAVDRVVRGVSPLTSVTPCDRVEAVSRLRRNRPDWSDEDLATHVGADADTVRVRTPDHPAYRYAWLRRGTPDAR